MSGSLRDMARGVGEKNAEAVAILLVDDDADCRQLMKDALDRLKLPNPVFEAESGEAALAFLHGEVGVTVPRPGLVFLDVEMAGIGGQETLRRIRAEKQFSDVAVVMLTGLTGDAEKRVALANGATSFTTKAADAEVFMQTVEASAQSWARVHQRAGGNEGPAACKSGIAHNDVHPGRHAS